jgi:hypothetical protein
MDPGQLARQGQTLRRTLCPLQAEQGLIGGGPPQFPRWANIFPGYDNSLQLPVDQLNETPQDGLRDSGLLAVHYLIYWLAL